MKTASVDRNKASTAHLETPSKYPTWMVILIFIHIILVFARPQSLPGLAFIGQIRIPGTLGIVCSGLWLLIAGKSKSKQTNVVLGFFLFEIARGLVGYFLDPANWIVKNDAFHWHSLKAVALICFGMTFHVIAFARDSRAILKLFKLISLLGGFLGLYGITHRGFGPGGFLGDENDLCATLLFMMPFSIACTRLLPSSNKRLFHTGVLLAIFGGIISTVSRGGMLGGFAAVGYLIYNSKHRSKAIGAVIALILIALPLTPQLFLDELASISTDISNTSGTVKKRYDSWKISRAIFNDSRFTMFGVGLNNSPHWMTQFAYKAKIERPNTYAGRAVHSLYFQLLADLGIYGILLCSFLFLGSFWSNHRTYKKLRNYLRKRKFDPDSQADLSVQRQLFFAENFNYAAAASLVGWIVAGIGVSILYYPTPWLWLGMSVACRLYGESVLKRAEQSRIETQPIKPADLKPALVSS